MFDEGEGLVCTEETEFLMRNEDKFEYKENKEVVEGIVPWKRNATNMTCKGGFRKYDHKIVLREEAEGREGYRLEVEETNNYVVLIKNTDELKRGIIVKN